MLNIRMAQVRMMSTAREILKRGQIHDNTTENVLSIPLSDQHSAEVMYMVKGNVYDLQHSSIPDEYQGQGLGSVLAERIFDHLIQRGKKLKLTCEFLHGYYVKNMSKYQNHVEE